MQLVISSQPKKYIKDALWLSYTALKDFLKCPRAYYLKNRYRNIETGNRLQIASAPMTLGSLVHDAIKWYLQTNRVASLDDVIKKFRNHWLIRVRKGGLFPAKRRVILVSAAWPCLIIFIKTERFWRKIFPALIF